MVRENPQAKGSYYLAVVFNSRIESIPVIVKDDKYHLSLKTSFPSLEALVTHYETSDLTGCVKQLKTCLLWPCGTKPFVDFTPPKSGAPSDLEVGSDVIEEGLVTS